MLPNKSLGILLLSLTLLPATTPGSAEPGGAGTPGSGAPEDSGTLSTPEGDSTFDAASAADVAARLGRPPRFLIGMGNDLAADHSQDGAYTLGVTLDLHYAYLVGLPGQGGWPDWNPGGTFVNILTDSADARGVVPMFTLYQMAAWGEGSLGGLTNAGFMGPYWSGARLLFERLAAFGKPAVVHLEPDFWGFAQSQNGNPAAIPAQVKAHAPECSDLPNDLTGVGRCLVRMARTIAPKVVIGFHASQWSGSTGSIAAYLNALGAGEADIVVVEALDRDAGCFEAAVDPNCQRGGGPWYWDESNATSPNFHEHLAWAQAISAGIGRPLLWWQMPFGVPSTRPGGTAGHYRDNRVRYLFAHTDEFVAAGGVGAVFGTGAGNQTYITTDGGQFRNAVHAYFASPAPLPLPGTPELTVTSPNGGESWPIGSQQQIRWTARNIPASASLRVTLLNGASGTTLTTLPRDRTSYGWTVAGSVTANARIRVDCVGCSSSTADESNAPFSIVAAPAPPPVPSDFNSDGHPDLLWHHQGTGDLYTWLLNRVNTIGGSYLDPSRFADTRWQIRGLADLDGNGDDDLLWHHQGTGDLYAWLMSGTAVASGSYLTPSRFADTAWQIRGVEDFNQDGKPDILWHHQRTGDLYVWFMNGTVTSAGAYLTPSRFTDTRWQIRGVRDLNRDGRPDILWHHQGTGDLYVWFMNGTVATSGSYLTPSRFADTRWQIRRVMDMNEDGNPDVLWHHQGTGALYAWFLDNALTVTEGSYLSPSAFKDTRWQIVPR